MQIIFRGALSDEQAAESVTSILKLFKDRYGIQKYREITMNITMLDDEGEEVELVDAETSKVFGVFEVHKSGRIKQKCSDSTAIRLVVDNTK